MKTTIAASVLAVSVCLCLLILTVRATVGAIPAEIRSTRADLVSQVQALRVEALAEIDTQATGIRKDAATQLSGIRKEALDEIETTRAMADAQLTGARADLKQTLAQSMTTVVAPVDELRSDLKPLIEHAASIAAQVDDAAPLFLDCEYNPDCAFNRFQGTSKAIENTLQAVAIAAPQLGEAAVANGKNIAGVTADLHTVTTTFLKPQTVKQKVWSAVKFIGNVARYL